MSDIRNLLARNKYYYKYNPESSYQKSLNPSNSPLISIIMPVYNGPAKWLKCAIHSVLSQSYKRWELCLADDCSTNSDTIRFLSKLEDSRVKIYHLEKNSGISAATNEGLSHSSGEYITFLDQDDELTNDALYEIVVAVNRYNPDLIYSDEDRFKQTLFRRQYIDAHFKPDYSPDLLLSHNYITHLLVIRKELLDRTGWFRSEFDGAQDYDLTLRAVELAKKICHIRKVLYHWRFHGTSISHQAGSDKKCNDAGQRAINNALVRRRIDGVVNSTSIRNHYRVRRNLAGKPLVSIIIPFCDNPTLMENCLSSIITNTTYPNYEVLGISNNSIEKRTFELMAAWSEKDKRIRFYEYNIPFNYSEINNHAVTFSNGDYLVLMNNDIQVINLGWMEALLEHAQCAEAGAVGGKLYYPDGSIQHAGITLGIKGFAGRPHRRFPGNSTGYFHRLVLTQNVSAVTGALMMIRRSKYLEVGGMDQKNLPISLNDVDFCLRLMENGYFNVYTPYCEAIHLESVSRGFEKTPEKNERFSQEIKYFIERHRRILSFGDPFYNPNLSLDNEDLMYDTGNIREKNMYYGCYCKNGGHFISN